MIQGFDFELIYAKGSSHTIADSLSRRAGASGGRPGIPSTAFHIEAQSVSRQVSRTAYHRV